MVDESGSPNEWLRAGVNGVCKTQHVMKTGGDVASYLSHVRFATEMLHSRNFDDCGAVKYDRMIIDKHLSGKSTNFNPNTVISSLTFSTHVIPDNVEICHGGSLTKVVISQCLFPDWIFFTGTPQGESEYWWNKDDGPNENPTLQNGIVNTGLYQFIEARQTQWYKGLYCER